MAQSIQYPTREQAIVLDAVEGLTISEYTVAVGKLIEPNNIRFVSRISHGRICLYLSSKELVEKLTETNTKVNIGTHSLPIRTLISKAKRVILSNVCPIIPNKKIIDELEKLQILPVSQISFIQAGMSEAGYAHILSFRRQIYVKPEGIEKISSSMQIEYDNTVFWIYLSNENVTCFLCNQEGHLAKHCKNEESNQTEKVPEDIPLHNNNTGNNSNINSDSSVDSVSAITTEDNNAQMVIQTHDLMMPPPPPPDKVKRALTSSTSSENTSAKTLDFTTLKPQATKHINKRARMSTPAATNFVSSEEILNKVEPAKKIFESRGDECLLPLTYSQLIEFLQVTFGQTNIPEIALSYTNKTDELIDLLALVYKEIEDTNLKARIRRIKARLEKNENSEITSDDSSSQNGE